ncbi:hypothetical protein LSH36_535g01059 [Paralvinella palmiformis]|uniref:Uncharacterized protein n=1 Tax=Paralvinella palmiformis TaxID=53620 RepID=A0AAD9J7J2_9ANNE|nr:hypothetical protein LSH36_535g01059 [Paralvinella palmiformis]
MNNTLPTEADTQMERDNEMFPWYTLGNILYATYLKALDTSSKLYQTGANIYQRTPEGGDSVLYLATFGTLTKKATDQERVKVIEDLLYAGASPYLTTTTGVYPIDLATNAGHMKAAELLSIDLDESDFNDEHIAYTPSRIRLGLLSPSKKHLVESTAPRRNIGYITRIINRSR